MGMDQCGGNFLRSLLFEQTLGEDRVFLVGLDRSHQRFDQTGAILCTDILDGRRPHPLGVDLGVAQHHLDTAAARIGDDDHRRALLARAAGAAGAMLQCLGIARNLDMDDEAERRQIDAARGDIGGDADAGAAVTQGLQRRISLALAMLARQSDDAEATLGQAGVEVADIVARRAEQHRRLGLMQPQQVHDRVLDIGRGNGDRLIADVAMAAILPQRLDAQRIALIALGQRDDRLGHRRREHEGAAGRRRSVENLFEIVAEAHVEHFVGLIEHRDLQRRQVERAAFEMIAQPPRRADNDMRAMAQHPPFTAGIHAADAGSDACARRAIEPQQLTAHLQGQLAGRRDDQRDRRAGNGQRRRIHQQLVGHGETESDGLARSGLSRDDQVAAQCLGLEDGGLDGRGSFIAAFGECLREEWRKGRERHGCSNSKTRRPQKRGFIFQGIRATGLRPIRSPTPIENYSHRASR